jgi:6-phosphofructokinase 1
MAALHNNEIISVPIKDTIARLRTVPPDHQLVRAARALGTSFGDDL